MKKLIINISGPINSGKSTIMRLISEALLKADIPHSPYDVDYDFTMDSSEKDQQLRLKALSAKIKEDQLCVEVRTIQLKKE